MRILFLTTANLSTNPRLYKEILLAESVGYSVSLVAFHQGGWSDEKDLVLLGNIKGRAVYLSALRKPFWPWFVSSCIHQVCIKIWPFFKRHLLVNALAHNKRTWLILNYLKQVHQHYDLIIGHNLGALYPAWLFAKENNIPFGFDVEDFHPGEASVNADRYETDRRVFLMAQLLPKAAYYSFASPMIGSYTAGLIRTVGKTETFLINNCFSGTDFICPSATDGALKMVWFSQNISQGRGLEWILPLLDRYSASIRLTLIGSVSATFYDEQLKMRPYVEVLHPMDSKTLNQSLSKYDVGLALELNSADLNRQLCLTNKIWAYLQAGLYIMATDTPAQRSFLTEHRLHGMVTSQDEISLNQGLQKIISEKNRIRGEAKERYLKAKVFNWETESSKLANRWSQLLENAADARADML